MNLEEAKKVLMYNRPERPRSTNQRQLQVAIDVVLDALKHYDEGKDDGK